MSTPLDSVDHARERRIDALELMGSSACDAGFVHLFHEAFTGWPTGWHGARHEVLRTKGAIRTGREVEHGCD